MLNRCAETLKPDSRAYYFDWMQLRYIHVAKTRATLLICNIYEKHDTGSSEGIAQAVFNLQLLDAAY
ncbi:TPA: hypothetical protein RY356_000143 [Escherichia albertii]|nr:hypothetical protein [Escherichia albertii]HEB0991396.1 hypothetical protein [Escherichia albertii]HEB0995959.1 hypothetical protein [Escherichia albertii]HEB1000539.1 hypothetical protein [Escherichia albertii]HEB1005061.1 hypothetical protein [Escherichia albertii]